MYSHKMLRSWLCVVAFTVLGSYVTQHAQAQQYGPKTLRFCGYDWEVRPAGSGGPGPNRWDPNNVWVDRFGNLHLKITKSGSEWHCAELYTLQRFGFGRYQFQVIGRIDQLDPNVVFGIFDYPTPNVGPDGTNEIDLEFARWGNAAYPIGNYTVYPAVYGYPNTSRTFDFTLSGDYTTHRFIRRRTQVSFQSLNGHRDNDLYPIAWWTYSPRDFWRRIPQQAVPVHINLWLFGGQPPTNGREVEIIVSRFSFTPLAP